MPTFNDNGWIWNAIGSQSLGTFSADELITWFDQSKGTLIEFDWFTVCEPLILEFVSSFKSHWPFLQKSTPSRVINVSSSAHLRGHIETNDLNSEKKYDAGDAYNQSKLANIMFTRELARKLTGTGVTVNAINPGLVDTELTRHMGVFKSVSG